MGAIPAEEPTSPVGAPLPLPNPLVPAPDSNYPPIFDVLPPKVIKAAYWPSFDAFPASSINTSYFTHIYYAFLLPEPETYRLNLTSFDQVKIPEFMHSIRTQNPPVKTLLSIGGAGNDPVVFSKMASTVSTRAIFINSTIEVARRYGFDGVDIDWEYPANGQDMSNLALLYQEVREAIVNEAKICRKPPLLLTSAVYYASKFMFDEPRSYPADAIRKYVDWVNPMCYDYHGEWENFTGAHSALYDPKSNISTSFGIGSWIQAGVPPEKIVLGLPLYGKTWKLRDPNVNGIGALAVGVGPGNGTLSYNQIVDFNNEHQHAVVVFDAATVSFYSLSGDSWIGYDDTASISWKVQYARSLGLGGYFFWALGQDKDWALSSQASNAWDY
ncbi:hypothetical protein FNV43_RR11396 [Rhamnella rubrinervis]|uniref:GH18 domain-containing protein n=1 Tax=Rhamnella rubrinervis TaxID=2594499 RepID=A0A8K0H5L8_9ROSA|nr:hypothetical protein FNV43_RR11396 [Rhamnella rubrinervis]